jgi:hypothetical protein
MECSNTICSISVIKEVLTLIRGNSPFQQEFKQFAVLTAFKKYAIGPIRKQLQADRQGEFYRP